MQTNTTLRVVRNDTVAHEVERLVEDFDARGASSEIAVNLLESGSDHWLDLMHAVVTAARKTQSIAKTNAAIDELDAYIREQAERLAEARS